MDVRRLQPADRPQWGPLWQGYLDFYEHVLDATVTDGTWTRLTSDDSSVVGLGAFDGPELVGICHLVFHPSTGAESSTCYLEDLFVRPDRRGGGVGRSLIAAAVDEAERVANEAMQKEVGAFEKKIQEMESQGNADPQAAMQAMQQLASSQRLAQRKLDTKIEQLRRTRDAEVERVERNLEAEIRREQDRQKWLAVLLPPIPPLVVAFFVFFRRRAQEREGVATSRLR